MEQKEKRVYRICPCHSTDIEGIQTWLEDMAAKGLQLEKDSIFLGIWSFIQERPKRLQYRLEAVKSNGWASEEAPDAEVQETAEEMGWSYITKYRSFHIYCSADPNARPLNSDPAVQAITVRRLRREMILHFLFNCVYVFLMCYLRSMSLGQLFLNGAMLGAVYTLAVIGAFSWFVLDALVSVIYLQKACRRLKAGSPLDRRKPWSAWGCTVKTLPVIFCAVIILGLLSSLWYAT